MTGAERSSPILTPTAESEIVEGHESVYMHDLPAALTDATAEFGFFAGNQVLAVAAHGFQTNAPHQGIAPKVQARTWDRIPIEIEHAVIDRRPWIRFASLTEDCGQIRVGEPVNFSFDEGAVQNGVAVQEEYEFSSGGAPSGVATTGGGEGPGGERDHSGAELARHID
jgi:hypothetical protein